MIAVLNESKNRIEAFQKEQREAVEVGWAENSVCLVPGDLLVDAVATRFGTRFKKERDSVPLATMIKPDEIADEIKALIYAITAP